MFSRLTRLSLFGVCLLAAIPSFAAEATYTPEQADLGERVANRYCVKCHDNSYFEGALYDAVRGQRVEYLLDPIRMTMPQDRPGSLKPRHNAALLAWIMSLNGVSPGIEALTDDLEALKQLTFPAS